LGLPTYIQAQQQAEFISELSVLSRVRHRNLAALCGLSTARGNLFLVLEFAKNGSLDAALRRGKKRSISLSFSHHFEDVSEACISPLHFCTEGRYFSVLTNGGAV
jgi:serine/threonine protein kinase